MLKSRQSSFTRVPTYGLPEATEYVNGTAAFASPLTAEIVPDVPSVAGMICEGPVQKSVYFPVPVEVNTHLEASVATAGDWLTLTTAVCVPSTEEKVRVPVRTEEVMLSPAFT